jgi:hypothetical protein
MEEFRRLPDNVRQEEKIFLDLHSNAPTLVTQWSLLTYRKALEQIARYFQREFGYDFLQYEAGEEEELMRGFLWCQGEYDYGYGSRRGELVLGGAVFRWREWSDAEASWALAWVWLHPYARNNGLLSRAWPYFQQRFGQFIIEPPWSPAMHAFLNHKGRIKKINGKKSPR